MANNPGKSKKQSWSQWHQDNPFRLTADITDRKAGRFIPRQISDGIHRITDSSRQLEVRRRQFEQEQGIRENVRQAERRAGDDVVQQHISDRSIHRSQAEDFQDPEMNGAARVINNLTNLHFLCAHICCVMPLHRLATLHVQVVSNLNNPTNLAMAACTVSFHPQFCERIKIIDLFGTAIHKTLPNVRITPYITVNLAGDARQTFGLSFTTSPNRSNQEKSSNEENTATVTSNVNASGTNLQEISSGSVLTTSEKSSQSPLSRNLEVNQQELNQEAGETFSYPFQGKNISQTKIPLILQKQFENVPWSYPLLDFLAPGLISLEPSLKKVKSFRSVPSTEFIYLSVGVALIIIRLVALRLSKQNKVKKKKNSSFLIFIINNATSLSSLSIACCSFSAANYFADLISSTSLLFFEKLISLLLLILHIIKFDVLIKKGLGSLTISPLGVFFVDFGKGFLRVILISFTFLWSGIFKTILINLLERPLSFFIDRFCFLLNTIRLLLNSLLNYIISIYPFSEKENIKNV